MYKYTMCIFKALSFSRIPRASSKDFTFARSARLFAPFPSVYFSFEFPACFSSSLLSPAIVLCRRTFSFVTSFLPLAASSAEPYFSVSLFSVARACVYTFYTRETSSVRRLSFYTWLLFHTAPNALVSFRSPWWYLGDYINYGRCRRLCCHPRLA